MDKLRKIPAPLVLALLVLLAVLAYFAQSENLAKVGVDLTPQEEQVDWNALLPEIKSILKANYAGVEEGRISILSTVDLTGDGLTEAVVSSGDGGAYTNGIAVFRAEDGKPMLATIRTEEGSLRNAEFAEGASAMNGVSFTAVSDKKGIFSAMYSINGRTADVSLENCRGDFYAWHAKDKLFSWDPALSGEMQRAYCEDVSQKVKSSNSLEYRNEEYGFWFVLPSSWPGYTEVETSWSGYRPGDEAQIELLSGPFITLKDKRTPTDSSDSWQDIPIMIYTLEQWQDGRGAISQAAPVAPAELGRNNKYVFVMPARSIGFRDTLGVQEVSEWLQSKPLKAI